MLPRHSPWQETENSSFSNLPVPLTPLIGRDAACAEAVAALKEPGTRLLTLHGTGGVGKTRLSIAVASNLLSHFVDGVYFVPLESVTRSELLPAAIAQALEIYTLTDETAPGDLIEYMSDMRALLVLDNFEQLLAAAPLLAEIMSGCAHLKMLVTSRSILHVRGEQIFNVEPLELPSADHKIDLAEVQKSPAVQLFIERARSVKRDFALDAANARAVVELCAHLDGLPLAIELAAARSKILSPKAMLARIDKRLQLLTGGHQDLPPRQQTIKDMVAWSYVLLTPSEQYVFRLLSVFAGGSSLEAVEGVVHSAWQQEIHPLKKQKADNPPDALDIVSSLVSKSLVRSGEGRDEAPRFSMLESVREYGLEMLRENHGEENARLHHALYFAQLAETAEPLLLGPDQIQWLDALDAEYANIRAALEWCTKEDNDDGREDTGGGEAERLIVGLRIASALKRYWEVRAPRHEGLRWLIILGARTPGMRTTLKEKALTVLGRIALNLTDTERSQTAYGEALSIARETGNKQGVSVALMGIGNISAELGNDEGALQAYKECLAISMELGNKAGISAALNNISLVVLRQGDPAEATHLLEQSIQLLRELEDKERLAVTLNNMARAYLVHGDLAQAAGYANQSFVMTIELGHSWNISYDLLTFASIAGLRGDHTRAAMLLASADAAYDSFAVRLDRYDAALRTQCLTSAREALGEEAFFAAWSKGQLLSPEEALKVVSHTAAPPSKVAEPPVRANEVAVAALSAREREVLRLVSQGLSDPEMAEQLILSKHTINAHLKNIYSKLNVSSRAAATRYALQNGLA